MTDKPIVPREILKVYEGRIFSLQVETLTLPKGGEMKAEIVRHPGSVVLIPLTADGEVLLVRQYRPAIGRWAWELPAGSLNRDEDVERAAVRECHEEVGLIPGQLRRLGGFYPTPGYCDEEMNYFLATGLREPRADEVAHADEDEDIEVQAYAIEAIARMIVTGEVIDLKTVAGLTLLRQALEPKA